MSCVGNILLVLFFSHGALIRHPKKKLQEKFEKKIKKLFEGEVAVCIFAPIRCPGSENENKRPRGLDVLLGQLLDNNKLGMNAYQPCSY